LSSLRQSEKETKKLLFDKGQEALQLEAKILPLQNKVIDLEEQTEGAKAKMFKLEERPPNKRSRCVWSRVRGCTCSGCLRAP